MSAQTVVGIFNSAAQAQQAVHQLEQAGFELDYVDVAHRTAANQGVGNTSDSSIGGFFSSLFGGDDNDDARNYTAAAQRGSSVVTVHVNSGEEGHRAATILDSAGAVDVDGDTASTSATTSATTNANTTATDYATTNTGQQTAQVIEENLQVGKRVEQTGGVRLRSRIVERPVEASVRLREEHVQVTRTPVDRPATEADFQAFKEGQIEVTESAERAVVGKEARVVEEVSLGKEVTEREETIHDTVRNTEVDVEQIPGSTTRTGTSYDQTKTSNS